jgi:hypothetical protein
MAQPQNEPELKLELLVMDVQLRRKQVIWETPRNIAIVVGVIATITGVIAGFVGYKIGQQTPPPIVIQMQQPTPR